MGARRCPLGRGWAIAFCLALLFMGSAARAVAADAIDDRDARNGRV